MADPFKFYEFFCGGGMARAGLGSNWKCLFANDFDDAKAAAYIANWGSKEIVVSDVANLKAKDLPDHADLVWASFPCQDLSLAGMGAGLRGDRSGTFWPFWAIIRSLQAECREPHVVVLENVCGALTSHEGKDFSAICMALNDAKYRFGAIVIDAVDFVPHSRPRLFFIGIKDEISNFEGLSKKTPDKKWHTETLVNAYSNLDKSVKSSWVWWSLPYPKKREIDLIDLIEEEPDSVAWHTPKETERLIGLMSSANLQKLENAKKQKRHMIGALYKRTRKDNVGNKQQRAEIRFDDIAGCLRTPTGGSSRQIIVSVQGNCVRSRLLSSREAARLMGLKDTYMLPRNYNDSYHLLGDGLVVPVVNYLAEFILQPLLSNLSREKKAV
jgi:DNA (cytosine-5)-methyltransferase 1